jgi:hypothetical protein
MTRTQIYLPEEMLMQIKLEAQIQGIKMSELIRQMLEIGFKTNKKTKSNSSSLKKMAGIYKNGGFNCAPEELSKKIDEIVYDL